MASRRDVLKSAGIAAFALGAPRVTAAAAPPNLRALTWCNLLPGGLGIKLGERILDVAAAAKRLGVKVPDATDEVIEGEHREGLYRVIAAAAKGPFIAEKDARFRPCITEPQKIVMLGYNYLRHVKEVGVPVPKLPVMFNKYNNALNGHRGKIALPTKVAKKFDYEVELQVIIGKEAREVSEADALNYVFGYATGNDFSARDLQFRDGKGGSQFMIGKTSDGFMPVGPYLAGAEVVGDPQKLAIKTRVNGEKRQASNTADMIFSCARIIEYASSIFTLMPGDLISTGTPEGVIAGKPEAEQVWLKAGDQVSCSVEKCGELSFELT